MTQSTQAIGTIIAALFAAPAMAQAPIAHFSMDGSPAPGEAYPAGASLQSVPGRHGQALKFDGQTVIAHPLDLEQHRRLTVTAWVKLDDTDEAGGFIASAGNGPGGPRLKINHRSDQLMVNVARAGMRVSREVPANEWTFVAVAVDLDAGEGRLQMGDAIDASDRLETDPNRVGQSAYDEPDDPDAAKRRYLFIGAQDFNMRQPATAMAIDDVRVYAAELSETEIDALRSPQDGGAGQPWQNLGSEEGPPIDYDPSYEVPDRTQDDGDSSTETDPTSASDQVDPSAAPTNPGREFLDEYEEARRRAAEATAENPPAEEESAGESDADEATVRVRTGWSVSGPDHLYMTYVSGADGRYRDWIEMPTALPINRIAVFERGDKPCRTLIGRNRGGPTKSEGHCMGDPGVSEYLASLPDDAVIRELRVCTNNRSNARVKGIAISGNDIDDQGYLETVRTDSGEAANCRDWKQTVRCNDGDIATGVVAERNESLEWIIGMRLICRAIVPEYASD